MDAKISILESKLRKIFVGGLTKETNNGNFSLAKIKTISISTLVNSVVLIKPML